MTASFLSRDVKVLTNQWCHPVPCIYCVRIHGHVNSGGGIALKKSMKKPFSSSTGGKVLCQGVQTSLVTKVNTGNVPRTILCFGVLLNTIRQPKHLLGWSARLQCPLIAPCTQFWRTVFSSKVSSQDTPHRQLYLCSTPSGSTFQQSNPSHAAGLRGKRSPTQCPPQSKPSRKKKQFPSSSQKCSSCPCM